MAQASLDHNLILHSGDEPPAGVDRLADAAEALKTALAAVRDAKLSSSFQPPDLGRGIPFYDLVRGYEIGLIVSALQRTGGNQRRAATLLGLKNTTLNSKIKVYKIRWRDFQSAVPFGKVECSSEQQHADREHQPQSVRETPAIPDLASNAAWNGWSRSGEF
jgi:DNA-binding protein Fis